MWARSPAGSMMRRTRCERSQGEPRNVLYCWYCAEERNDKAALKPGIFCRTNSRLRLSGVSVFGGTPDIDRTFRNVCF
jgi:hypothetical protein